VPGAGVRKPPKKEPFKSPRQVQRFLSAHDQAANVFLRRRDHDTAASLRFGRTQAFANWADVTGVAMAA
jgi:putative transposase